MTRFGIGLPQVFAGEAIDPGAIRAIARRAEALGFADGWVQESLLSRSPALDGLELLSHVAAVTDRIGLGISVVVCRGTIPSCWRSGSRRSTACRAGA